MKHLLLAFSLTILTAGAAQADCYTNPSYPGCATQRDLDAQIQRQRQHDTQMRLIRLEVERDYPTPTPWYLK